MLLLALFPILAFGTVIYVALNAVSEHEARWDSNSTYACCEARAAVAAEHQLAA